jgi:hypothetical protein
MLLQTNSYIVPKDKRSEHARLVRKFRQTLARLGCDQFEVYEQVGANWAAGEATGRFVQIMRFRDRKHQQEVQAGERQDPVAQKLIQEFCALINFPYQQQQGLFAVGFYASSVSTAPAQPRPATFAAAAPSPMPKPPSPLPQSSTDSSDALLDLPEATEAEPEGASMLDFAALTGAASTEPTPLRLAGDDDTQDAVVESTMPPSDGSPNGEHGDAVGDAIVEDAVDLTDADREAIVGEIEDDDTESDARKQQADGR